jgi:hypothetical protein
MKENIRHPTGLPSLIDYNPLSSGKNRKENFEVT